VWLSNNKISPYCNKEAERIEVGMKSAYKVNFAAAVAEINATPPDKNMNFKFALEGSLEVNEVKFKAIAEKKRLELNAEASKAAIAVMKLKNVRQKAVVKNSTDLTANTKKVMVRKSNEELLSAIPEYVKTNALSTAVSLITMSQSRRGVPLSTKIAKEGKRSLGGSEGTLDFKIRNFIPSASPSSFYPVSPQSVVDLLAMSSSSSSSSSASSSSSLPSFPHATSSSNMFSASSGSDSSKRSMSCRMMPSQGDFASDNNSITCEAQMSAVCPVTGSISKRDRESNSGSITQDSEREKEMGTDSERLREKEGDRDRGTIVDSRHKRKRFQVTHYPLQGAPVIIPGPVHVPTPVPVLVPDPSPGLVPDPSPGLVPDLSPGLGTLGVEGSVPVALPVQYKRKSPIGTLPDAGSVSGLLSGAGSGPGPGAIAEPQRVSKPASTEGMVVSGGSGSGSGSGSGINSNSSSNRVAGRGLKVLKK
jgi:hypothetical protein